MDIQALWNLSNSLLGIIIILSLVCLASIIWGRHGGHKRRDKELCESYNGLPNLIKTMCISLIDRRYSSIQNYYIFQIINKVFGFTGVLYSVLGFGITLMDFPANTPASDIKMLSMRISLISIICVIIALYLSPTKRVAEYITAWRRYDRKISSVLSRFPEYVKLGEENAEEVAKIVEEISQFIFNVENDITSDCE